MQTLFPIILGFYSHILSSLGTVKASFHLLITCSACNHCRVVGSLESHMKRPPSQEGSSSPASSSEQGPRELWTDFSLERPLCLRTKLFLRREREHVHPPYPGTLLQPPALVTAQRPSPGKMDRVGSKEISLVHQGQKTLHLTFIILI